MSAPSTGEAPHSTVLNVALIVIVAGLALAFGLFAVLYQLALMVLVTD